jgi:hypothetical protein
MPREPLCTSLFHLGLLLLGLPGLIVPIRILIELVLAILTAEGITFTVMRTSGRSLLLIYLHTANWVFLHVG